jgi:hypothetical protein
MSWNAGSGAQAEVIEYLEELTDLAKLLVGANEFRGGLLARPAQHELAQYAEPASDDDDKEGEGDGEAGAQAPETGAPEARRVRSGSLRSERSGSVPVTLQRISSRKREDELRRRTCSQRT